jgi:hypothetical protein
MKVLEETATARSLKLKLEANAGSVVELKLRRNATKLDVHADGAELVPVEHGSGAGSLDSLTVKFPSGAGYQQQTVTLHW